MGLSQEALAERADLRWTYMGGIERGERNVSLINIVRIARALELTPGRLAGRREVSALAKNYAGDPLSIESPAVAFRG